MEQGIDPEWGKFPGAEKKLILISYHLYIAQKFSHLLQLFFF